MIRVERERFKSVGSYDLARSWADDYDSAVTRGEAREGAMGWFEYLNWRGGLNGPDGVEAELLAHGADPKDIPYDYHTLVALGGLP